MHAAEWIALGIGVFTILINLATIFIGYGVLKGTVSALAIRVTAMEADLNALAEIKLQVARVETRLDGLIEQFKDLNSAVRWMREPADYQGVTPARTRRRET